jgi:hypothetical protein
LDEGKRLRRDGYGVGVGDILKRFALEVLLNNGGGKLTFAPMPQMDRQKNMIPMAKSQSNLCIVAMVMGQTIF